MAYKIKHVTKRFRDIAEERSKYHLINITDVSSSDNYLINRETHASVIESDVYGRGKDRENVINFLVNIDNDKDVSILSIVGLGGIGKTTLAQLVYNDDRIKSHFELKAWVCVSETFEVKIITINILESITGEKCDLSNLQAMQHKLQEHLSHRKFLLVLDDVWNENREEWEKLKPLLTRGKHGSKILITTRSTKVASIMGTVAPFHLECLSDNDCWTLFKQRAFGSEGQVETPELAKIGRDIVDAKCGGLPLAAKVLGSLMGSIRGENGWLSIKNIAISKLPLDCGKSILSVLKLSYNYLSYEVKQCFVYCSLFPKDYLFDKKKLIQLWIAEGFILSSSQFDTEALGDLYFDILLWRSFFQDEEKDEYGNVVRCKMHDLVHDLACDVAGDESCTVVAGSDCKKDVSPGCRYMSVVFPPRDDRGIVIPKADYKSVKLRTFSTFTPFTHGATVKVQWGTMSRHLRVLDFSGTRIGELPDSLGILKHLRLLDLSRTYIKTIPDSIISLQKLQTLELRGCYQLERLPKGIIFLSRLRHLDISYCDELNGMPRGIGQLANLRTLPIFKVGKEGRGGTIMELQHLNLIRGELIIHGLERVKDGREAMQANLAAKTGLQSLGLLWDPSSSSADNTNEEEEDVLENLRPPINLKCLRIIGHAGTRFPSWMTTTTPLSLCCCLPNLAKIYLRYINRCKYLPPLGHLPSLQELRVYNMPELVEWPTEPISTTTRGGMESMMIYPRLECIQIIGCHKLARLPLEWLFDLTALLELDIKHCPLVGDQHWIKSGEEWEKKITIDI